MSVALTSTSKLDRTATVPAWGDFSYLGWLYHPADQGDSVYALALSDASDFAMALRLDGSDVPQAVKLNQSAATSSAGHMATATWRRFALVFDNTANTLTLYEGSADFDAAMTQTAQLTEAGSTTITRLAVGQFAGSVVGFAGRVSNLKLYTSVLTPTRLQEELKYWNVKDATNLWGAWRLRAHTDLTDTSGNGRNLTGSGTLTTEADPPVLAELYVNTASSAGGNGTTNATAGANRAYVSLYDALDAFTSFAYLASPTIIYCEGTAADTTGCPIAVWEMYTTPTTRLTIKGNNTSGKWDTTKYRLEVTNVSALYNNYASHVTIEDFQAQVTITGDVADSHCYRLATANNHDTPVDHLYRRCLARAVHTSGTGHVNGFADSDPFASGGTCRRINCVAFNVGAMRGYSGSLSDDSAWATSSLSNLNCTYEGFDFNYLGLQICKNCIADDSVDTYGFAYTGSSGHTNNASDDGSALGANARTGQVFSFVDPASGDFHLQASDLGAQGYGLTDPASGLYLDDIDGETRIAPWDIGADQITDVFDPPVPGMLVGVA